MLFMFIHTVNITFYIVYVNITRYIHTVNFGYNLFTVVDKRFPSHNFFCFLFVYKSNSDKRWTKQDT